jgi:ankyrin repeat protein
MIEFTSPSGQKMNVQVPQGLQPGDRFPVDVGDVESENENIRAITQELCAAAQGSDLEACRAALAKGANVNARFTMGFTPVFYASTYGHKDVLQLFLDQRADVGVINNEGRSPLHWAVRNGHVECALMLIQARAVLNGQDRGGKTPLAVASSKNMTECVRLLEQYGATL